MTCRACLLLALALAAACTPLPDLAGTVAPDVAQADYLPLVPFDQIAASLPPPEAQTAPDARSAALRARAARLRGAVIDPAARARMGGGVPGAAAAD